MRRKSFEFRDRRRLLGGFVCRVTEPECNAWHEHVRTTPEYAQFMTLQAELHAESLTVRGGSGDKSQVIDLCNRLVALEERLFDIGKAWYAATVQPQLDADEAELANS